MLECGDLATEEVPVSKGDLVTDKGSRSLCKDGGDMCEDLRTGDSEEVSVHEDNEHEDPVTNEGSDMYKDEDHLLESIERTMTQITQDLQESVDQEENRVCVTVGSSSMIKMFCFRFQLRMVSLPSFMVTLFLMKEVMMVIAF